MIMIAYMLRLSILSVSYINCQVSRPAAGRTQCRNVRVQHFGHLTIYKMIADFRVDERALWQKSSELCEELPTGDRLSATCSCGFYAGGLFCLQIYFQKHTNIYIERDIKYMYIYHSIGCLGIRTPSGVCCIILYKKEVV